MLNLGRVPAARSLPPGPREALRTLLEEVVSTTPRRRRWWFSRSMVLVVTGTAVLGGAAAAGALVAARPATDKKVVRCYSVAVLEGGNFAGVTVARGGDPGAIPIEDALATCAELWRQGVVVAGVASAQDPGIGVDAPVPELAACTLESGVAAVFPGDAGTCGRLGLPDLLAG
jgi:hypothetical protein